MPDSSRARAGFVCTILIAFDDEDNWTVKWNMTVPGATYENTVDNRAWE